jgi:hypothetical protein
MTIYVVYYDYDYEGCSEPIAAFLTEEKAREWIQLHDSKYYNCCFQPLIIDDFKSYE